MLKIYIWPQISVTRDGFRALAKLKLFKEFYFTPAGDTFVRRALVDMCFEILPHLNVAGNKPKIFWATAAFSLCAVTTEALYRLEDPCGALKLRQVALTTLNSVPRFVEMPELVMLYLESTCRFEVKI